MRLLHSKNACVGGPETVVGQHLTLQRPWMWTALWKKKGIALLAKHVKPSVITGMRARMTEQIFALNALSGQGNCYWYDLYFQRYCFWQSYRLCRCLLATKSFFKNVGSVPKPEESECEGVCYSTHTAAFGDSNFQETSFQQQGSIVNW